MAMRSRLASIVALALSLTALPLQAQTTDELRQQLEAQKTLNEQLRRRVTELEQQLSGRTPSEQPALRDLGRAPVTSAPETPETTTAIKEALVARGLVLLPSGSYRLIPGFGWTYSASNALRTRSDGYAGSLGVQAGLPAGMMLSASVPYLYRNTSIGSNRGMGDWSVNLAKQLVDETDRSPSLVASLGYQDNSNKKAFDPVSIGSAFPVVSARLSALKRLDPVAIYGDISHAHPYAKYVNADNLLGEAKFSGRIAPGSTAGMSFGASLVATPEITFDAGVTYSFVGGTRVDSTALGSYGLPRARVGFFTLGAGFLVSKNLSLLISAGAGLTEESSDFFLSFALPYRF